MGLGSYFLTGYWNPPKSSAPSDAPLAPGNAVALRDSAGGGGTPLNIRQPDSWYASQFDGLTLISVFRAVQILQTSISQMTLTASRADGPLFPQPGIIRQPDIKKSLSAFLGETVASLALTGDAFWLVDYDNQGRASNVQCLDSRYVVVEYNSWGMVTGYRYMNQYWAPQSGKISHLQYLRRTGFPRGLGPIQAARAELAGARDARDYGAQWFADSHLPQEYMTTDQTLTKEQAAAYKQQFIDSINAAEPAVFGNGLKPQTNLLSPADAQWLDVQGFNVAQVARLFGIPFGLMNAPLEGSAHLQYANISQSWTELARFTLSLYTSEIEQALSAILPRGTNVTFNFESLLRPDTQTRYANYGQAVGKWMTVNEVRAAEGLPPIEGGDDLSAPAPAVPPQPEGPATDVNTPDPADPEASDD